MQPSALGGGSTALQDGATTAASGGTVDANQPVLRFSDFTPVGTSRLVRTPNGVSFNLATGDLTAGHAYTLWMVIFNEPGMCAVPDDCGEPDIGNDAAKPDMVWVAGTNVGGPGTATFAGRRSLRDSAGSINAPAGLPAYGLLDPYGAEIWLAVHDHGPALPQFMPDMIKTVAGGCTDAGIPEAGAPSPFNDYMGPEYGRRGPNTCATIQAAFHKP